MNVIVKFDDGTFDSVRGVYAILLEKEGHALLFRLDNEEMVTFQYSLSDVQWVQALEG